MSMVNIVLREVEEALRVGNFSAVRHFLDVGNFEVRTIIKLIVYVIIISSNEIRIIYQ